MAAQTIDAGERGALECHDVGLQAVPVDSHDAHRYHVMRSMRPYDGESIRVGPFCKHA
jgi:hypothetical protein